MGNTPLSALAGGFNAWCDPTTGLIPQSGGSCAGATGNTTVLQLDVAGQLGSAPVGSTPVGSTPVGSTPVGSTPVGLNGDHRIASRDDPALDDQPAHRNRRLHEGQLRDGHARRRLCGRRDRPDRHVLCGAARRGDEHSTDHDQRHRRRRSRRGRASRGSSCRVQGLQPYSQTQPHVTYRLSASVDCSVASSFTFTARLPAGFFPVNGSASISFDGGATSQAAGAPTVLGTSAGAAAKLNSYQWPLACGNLTAPVNAVLSFDSFVGLQLGTFSMGATAAAGAFSLSATGAAPVTVGQNGEPATTDPTTAPTIKPGHARRRASRRQRRPGLLPR